MQNVYQYQNSILVNFIQSVTVLLNAVSDIDECGNQTTHECEHICNNINGSYVCSCEDGYDLNLDGFSCDGKP